jgi:hypothetical protein
MVHELLLALSSSSRQTNRFNENSIKACILLVIFLPEIDAVPRFTASSTTAVAVGLTP